MSIEKIVPSSRRIQRPSGVKKLKGSPELWRVRVGDYRIVYSIADDILVVLVVKIGNRRDVYR